MIDHSTTWFLVVRCADKAHNLDTNCEVFGSHGSLEAAKLALGALKESQPDGHFTIVKKTIETKFLKVIPESA